MSHAEPAEQTPRRFRGRRLVLLSLGLATILACCALAMVSYLIWGFPGRQPEGGADGESRHEVRSMSAGLESFEAKFNMEFVPSRFVLCETIKDYQIGMSDPKAGRLYADSWQYLNRIWPRINFENDQPGPLGWKGIDWNGNGVQDPPVILEGDQCLVFFLGGIQSSKENKLECLGFSTNGSNPALGGGNRVAPFFEFKSSRLRAKENGYFVYLDPYCKTPYAYFSGYKVRNGYNRYLTTDCNSIPDGPYHDGEDNYYNPNSFQIISAGADGKFGRGGKWTPEKANEIDSAGRDDLSNFHATLLGKPR